MTKATRAALLIAVALGLAACGEKATLPVEAGIGPSPQLPPPNQTLIPTVNIAPAEGWPAGGNADAGRRASRSHAFADRPRPSALALRAAERRRARRRDQRAAAGPRTSKGIKGWFMSLAMKQAGAGVPSANRITLLRDADGDGVAEIAHACSSRT